MWAEMLMCVVFLIDIDLSSQSGQGSGSGIPPGDSAYPEYFENLVESGQERFIHPQQQPNPGYPNKDPNPGNPQQHRPGVSSQSKKGKGKKIPEGYLESFILDSGHGPQIRQEMITYDEKGLKEMQEKSQKTKRSYKYFNVEHPTDLNLSIDELRKAERSEKDKARNILRSKKHKEELAMLRGSTAIPPQTDEFQYPPGFNASENPEEAKRLRKEAAKATKAEKTRVRNRQKANIFYGRNDDSLGMHTQTGQFQHSGVSSSPSEQDNPPLQLNLHNNQFNGRN